MFKPKLIPTPRLCRCGDKTEEDWGYCSRECGVAEALARLTARLLSSPLHQDDGATRPLPSDYDRLSRRESPDLLTIESLLYALERAEACETDLTRRQQPRNDACSRQDNAREPNPFDDRFSADGTITVEDWEMGDDGLRDGKAQHHSSLETIDSSEPRNTSPSDAYYSTPATSVSSTDSLSTLAWKQEKTSQEGPYIKQDRVQNSRRVHRRGALSDLRAFRDVSPNDPKDLIQGVSIAYASAGVVNSPPSLGTSFSGASSQEDGIMVEQGHQIVELEGRGDSSTTYDNEESASLRKETMTLRNLDRISDQPSVKSDVSCNTLASQISSSSATSNAPRAKLLITLRKTTSRLFAKLSRQSSKRHPGMVHLAPVGSLSPTASSPLTGMDRVIHGRLLATPRHTISDFPMSPTASTFSATASIVESSSKQTYDNIGFIFAERRRGRIASCTSRDIATLATPSWSVRVDNAQSSCLTRPMHGPTSRPSTPTTNKDYQAENIDGSPVLGPGQAVYLEVLEVSDLAREVGDDWNDFAEIYSMLEQSNGILGQGY